MQTEGSGTEGGRGPATWDGFIQDNIAGLDIAVDSYHRYKVHVILMDLVKLVLLFFPCNNQMLNLTCCSWNHSTTHLICKIVVSATFLDKVSNNTKYSIIVICTIKFIARGRDV